MNFVGVIPARYSSTRFPGKPLALIKGKPLIQHVYEQVTKSRELQSVIVATDHEEIEAIVKQFGGQVVMTSTNHETGSDRIAEVTTKMDGDFFVNIQGDEPLIQADLIDELIKQAKNTPNAVITAKTRIKANEDIENPNVVKVVTDKNGKALYFSRSPIPYNRSKKEVHYYKHLGIYCYPKTILQEFVQTEPTPYEQVEVLEQLRILENGISIYVVETENDAIGVDTPEDIEKVENYLGGRTNGK